MRTRVADSTPAARLGTDDSVFTASTGFPASRAIPLTSLIPLTRPSALQKRLRKQLDSTLRMANKAQQKLQQGDDDEDTVGGITQLIEEAMGKHEQVRNEMGSHGVTMPMSTAVTDNLSSVLHAGTGQRMAMERQVGDIQEACRQLKVCASTMPAPASSKPPLLPPVSKTLRSPCRRSWTCSR